MHATLQGNRLYARYATGVHTLRVQENFFSRSDLAMLIAHLAVAAPVTAPDARLHGGPAGVCANDSTRASQRARAHRPHPPKKPPQACSTIGGEAAIVDHVRTGSTVFVFGRRCTQGTRVRSAEPRARSLHVFSHHYTPLFTAIFFAEMHAIQAAPRVAPSAGLQGHWSGADAAARTPAAAPTPAAAALAVAAATDAQGRRRALRELRASATGAARRSRWRWTTSRAGWTRRRATPR